MRVLQTEVFQCVISFVAALLYCGKRWLRNWFQRLNGSNSEASRQFSPPPFTVRERSPHRATKTGSATVDLLVFLPLFVQRYAVVRRVGMQTQ